MKGAFPSTASPASLLPACIRRFCTGGAAASTGPPAILPSRIATALPETPPVAARARRGAAARAAAASPAADAYPRAATAPAEATASLRAFAVFDATPGEIVTHAQRLALSPHFTWASTPAAGGATSHRGESRCTSASPGRFFSAEEQELQVERQQPTYSATTAATVSASWGDLIFRAHGVLHAFSPSQLVQLLRFMAAAGPVSLARCSRSPIHAQQQRLQQQQLKLYLQKQQQEQRQLLMQSHCTNENQLLPQNKLKHLSDRSINNKSRINRLEMWNSHHTQTGSRSSHASRSLDSVSCTSKCSRTNSSSVVEASSSGAVGSGAIDASSRIDGSTGSGPESGCVADTSNVKTDGDSVQADISDTVSNLDLSCAPRVFSHQLQGRSIDFFEALVDRLCAEQVLEGLSIDELATVVNSLHLLQYAHPLLVRRLRDAPLPSTPACSTSLSEPRKVEPLSSDATDSLCRNGVNNTATRGNGSSDGRTKSDVYSSGEKDCTGSDRGGSRYIGGSSRIASEDSSSVVGESSSSNCNRSTCGNSGSDSSSSIAGRGSAPPSDRQVDDRVDTADARTEATTAAETDEQQQPNTQCRTGKEETIFSSTGISSSGRHPEADAVLTQQQQKTPFPILPAGLLAGKLAALLTHLERQVLVADSMRSSSSLPIQQRSTSWPARFIQVHLEELQRQGEALASQAATAAVTTAPLATSEDSGALSASARMLVTSTRAVDPTTTPAVAALAEPTAAQRAASCAVRLKWAERDKREAEVTLREGFLEGVLTANAAAARRQFFPDLPRLTRIWHCCCSMGLISPQLASHVLAAFDKSAKSLEAEEVVWERFPADLLFVIRAGAMHLTRQPLLHQAVIPGSTMLFLLTSRDTGSASVPSPLGSLPENLQTRAAKAAVTATRPSVHSKNRQITLQYGEVAGISVLNEESRAVRVDCLHAVEKTQEAAVDAAVSELIDRSLRHLQEQVISMDLRHIALLLEAFALASFSVGRVKHSHTVYVECDTFSLLVTSFVACVRYFPEAVASIVSSVAALDIRCDDLLQALSYRACEAISQYTPSALALLALDMAKLNHLASPLLSEVAAHMEEVEASLSRTDFAELETLLKSKGLRQSSPDAPVEKSSSRNGVPPP